MRSATFFLCAWLVLATCTNRLHAEEAWSNEDAWTFDALQGRTTAALLATARHLQDVLQQYPALPPYGREELRNTGAERSWTAYIEQSREYAERVRSVLSGRAVRVPEDAPLGASGDVGPVPVAVTLTAEGMVRCNAGEAALIECTQDFLARGVWTVPLGRAVTVLGPDGAAVATVFAVRTAQGPVAVGIANAGSNRERQHLVNRERMTPAAIDAVVSSFVEQLAAARAPGSRRQAVDLAVERVRAAAARVEQVFTQFSQENETTRRATTACRDIEQLPLANVGNADKALQQMKPLAATVVAGLAEARRLATACSVPEDGRRALLLHEKARSDYWDLDDITRVARSHLTAIPRFHDDLKAARASRPEAARHLAALQRTVDDELSKSVAEARGAVDVYRRSLDQHARIVGSLLREAMNLRGAFRVDDGAPPFLAAGFKRLDAAFVAEEADMLALSGAKAIDAGISADNERSLSLRRIAEGRIDDLAACSQIAAGNMPDAIRRDLTRIESEVAATYRTASQAFSEAKDLSDKATACGR